MKATPYRQWGHDLEPSAIEQMRRAMALPVTRAGALMPDAHPGYGLPIGGVLATENAVIPYAVGVDIACRMKLSVLDPPVSALETDRKNLRHTLERETVFGVGGVRKRRLDHPVMDRDWSATPLLAGLKDKAWSQLGTSGSGNHFVEFGELTVLESGPGLGHGLGLEPGRYLALLSHSGSRGTGATIADHYSKLAMSLHPELEGEARRLAWLDMDSAAGQEYWNAMEMMGHYASANHAMIHQRVTEALGARVIAGVENHHNFAWRERHFGRDVIVHRKGATPAGRGVLGVIPGSMGAPGYVVRGRGEADSLGSAAHGAGRRMSRKQAKANFNWPEAREFLKARGVELISAGLDEVPMAYKDIERVMAAQSDLVEILARFDPRLVKMAPAGERPED